MSSFSNPHYMYLFAMKNGKKKLAYGQSPEDALNILAMRLSEAEMAQIIREQCVKIKQRDLQQYVTDWGNGPPCLERAMRLTHEQRNLLRAMASGSTLKAHRYLDGTKEYRLHPLGQAAEIVARSNVEALQAQGLIDSNKKFPAATFWLTAAGRAHSTNLTLIKLPKFGANGRGFVIRWSGFEEPTPIV